MIDRERLGRLAERTRSWAVANIDDVSTCILTSRIGIAVLEQAFAAEIACGALRLSPQPVFVTVMTPSAWRLAEQGVPVSHWPDSAWSVGVSEHSTTGRAGGWDGHLVISLRERAAGQGSGASRSLLDLTADQFSRPQRGITIEGPILVGIRSTWTPKDPVITRLGEESDPEEDRALVVYRPMAPGHRAATSWRESPDWSDKASATVAEAVAEILSKS